MEDNRHIGTRIKDLRVSHGDTQTSLANSVGISRSLLAQIERGGTKPTLEMLYKIVRLYNTTYEYLIEGVSNEVTGKVNDYLLPENQNKVLNEPKTEYTNDVKYIISDFSEKLVSAIDRINQRIDKLEKENKTYR